MERPSNITDIFERAKATKDIPTIYIVDVSTRKTLLTLRSKATGAIAWSTDGSRIAVATPRGLQIFDAHNGQLLMNENLDGAAHMHVRYTPDDRYLLESDTDARGNGLGVMIWDQQHQRLIQQIKANVSSLAVSSDGRYFAAGEDGHTSVWQFQ